MAHRFFKETSSTQQNLRIEGIQQQHQELILMIRKFMALLMARALSVDDRQAIPELLADLNIKLEQFNRDIDTLLKIETDPTQRSNFENLKFQVLPLSDHYELQTVHRDLSQLLQTHAPVSTQSIFSILIERLFGMGAASTQNNIPSNKK